jgi:hypothetical protein
MPIGIYEATPNTMKRFTFHIACLLLSCFACAEGGHNSDSNKAMAKNGTVQVKFQNNFSDATDGDSVLIIFDRWDKRGAGVVFQIYHEDKDHTITIPAIPAGSYDVTIQCLGMHHDRMVTHIRLKARKNETIKVRRETIGTFIKGNVVMPADQTDLSNLHVTKMK